MSKSPKAEAIQADGSLEELQEDRRGPPQLELAVWLLPRLALHRALDRQAVFLGKVFYKNYFKFELFKLKRAFKQLILNHASEKNR